MKRLLIVFVLTVLLTVGVSGNSENLYGENPIASKEEFLKYFNDHPNLSFYEREDGPIMVAEGAEQGSYLVLSKEPVELEEYTLSVTVAGIASEPRDFHEIPIVIGSDAEHKNAHQIFISRRPTHIAFRHARRVNGQYSITFDSNLDYIMEDDTFFTITIQVSGINANLFLNGEYVTTISEDSGFKGYLGFRWTNSLDFKSIELYEGIVEPETPEATEKPEETQTPKPTDKQEETPAPTETEKPSGTTPSNTDTDDEKEKMACFPSL